MQRTALPILFFALQMFAQRAAAPAFEVATIKPAVPISSDDFRSGKARPGLTVNASQVRIRYWALSNLILKAYGIQLYQLSAPDWTRTVSATFDIVAKMPAGSTPAEVPEMLQTLLKDRFKLVAHRENRDSQVYVLVLGKNRPRMKAAPPDAPYALQMLPRPDGIYHFQLTVSSARSSELASYVGRPSVRQDGAERDLW
jgi:uncharacterized protein (TIGR03435 family)